MTFIKGIVIKGQGHPKGVSTSTIELLNQQFRLKYRKHSKEMIDKQIEKAKSGYLPAFIYLTDRVLGRPTENIKMAAAVKLVMNEW